MIFQAAGTVETMDLYAESQDILQKQSTLFAPEELPRMIGRLHEAMTEMKWSPQPRITVEVALMALCRPDAAASEKIKKKRRRPYLLRIIPRMKRALQGLKRPLPS